MANENNPIFKIDARKILATLHIAARQAVPNAIVINSGIQNDDPKATPDKVPENMLFDLSNKNGIYQLALIPIDQCLTYLALIEYDKLDDIQNAKKEILEILAKNKDSDEKKSITTKPSDTENKELKDKTDNLYKLYSATINGFKTDEKKSLEENELEFLKAIKGENQKRFDDMKKSMASVEKSILGFEGVKQYLTSFAGKENANKLRPADIEVITCFSSNSRPQSSDINTAEMFEIKKFLIFKKKYQKKESETAIKNSMKDCKQFVYTVCAAICSFETEVETM